MRITLVTAVLVMGLQSGAVAGPTLEWEYDGYASLPDAAREAKQSGKRLLVGLAGSPT